MSNMKRRAFALLSAIVLVGLDQLTKYYARLKLADGPFSIIKGVFSFTYLENRGGMWGSFQGHYMILAIFSIIVTGLLILLYLKIPVSKRMTPLRIVFILLISGAIGNFIDRIWLNYVTDFIYVELIHFPIFNVADIYVTCSAFALIFLIGFFYKEEDISFIPGMSGKSKQEKEK